MSTEELSKMGAARVLIADYDGVECIHKQDASEVERHFYQYVAPHLEGVNTPTLFKIEDKDLYIERIPNRISLEQLLLNDSTFEQLASIHRSDYQPGFSVKPHQWTREETESALAVLRFPETTKESIRHVQAMSHILFERSVLISGDSNDGNWGTRHNGELVLFDWERFGFGSPAIDLAPLVSRMGSQPEYTAIVDKYIRHNSVVSGEQLFKELIIAKSWLVIEVTNLLVRRNKPETSLYLNWYNENVPKWLESVVKDL